MTERASIQGAPAAPEEMRAEAPGRLPSLERPSWLLEELGDPTGAGVRVAVVDSGRDPAWEEPRILPGTGLVDAERGLRLEVSDDDQDRIGHGTAISDLILGMAPGVEILPLRVFHERLESSPNVIAAALERAIAAEARVVNLSLGTPRREAAEILRHAASLARQCGLVLVSAVPAGAGWIWPGTLPDVIGVEAGEFPNVYSYEYRHTYPTDCRAQSRRRVRWLGGESRVTSGSSLATAHVSALVALFLERHPQAEIPEVRRLLQRFSVPTAPAESGAPAG